MGIRESIGFAIMMVLAPPLAAFSSCLRVLREAAKKRFLLFISVAFNLVFLSGLIAVMIEDEDAELRSRLRTRYASMLSDGWWPSVAPGLVLCEPPPGSESHTALPDTLFLIENDGIRATVEFSDMTRMRVRSVAVRDAHSRPWVHCDLTDGTMIVNIYETDDSADPIVMFRDRDGDGIPDVKIDWADNLGYERVSDPTWRALKSGTDEGGKDG